MRSLVSTNHTRPTANPKPTNKSPQKQMFDIIPVVPGSFRDRLGKLLKSTLGFVLPNARGTSLLFGAELCGGFGGGGDGVGGRGGGRVL
jgi:hypothetical protein